jgi:hypothetical protein
MVEHKESLLVVFIISLLLGLAVAFHISEPKKRIVEKEEFISTIDSVWQTSPGQENTLQTDYHYYGRLSNGQVVKSNSNAFTIGDSVKYIYYHYKK